VTTVIDLATQPDRTPSADAFPGHRDATSSHSGAALYTGTIRHRHFGAVAHEFTIPLFLLSVDVDTLPDVLDRLPLWSARRVAPIQFRRRDYLDSTDRPLGAAVRDLVEARTGHRPDGPVQLLTQPRTLGWLFNPISIYFCYDPTGGSVVALVLEVTNTPWHERSWYVIEVDPAHPNGPWEFAKTMHVSPFLTMDLTYRLRCTTSTDRITLRLEDTAAGTKVFDADLSLHRIALDRRSALLVPLRHPLQTWRVSGAIYAHAARLLRKGAPIVKHVHRPADPTRSPKLAANQRIDSNA
jgi:DUF1365 family protein